MKHLKTKKTLTLLILATYLLFTGCETTTQNTMKINKIAKEVTKSFNLGPVTHPCVGIAVLCFIIEHIRASN